MRVTSVIIHTFFFSFALMHDGAENRISFVGRLSSRINMLKEYLFSPKRDLTHNDVEFHLYHRRLGRSGKSEVTLAEMSMNKGKIFFIIHGYMSGRNHSWYKELTQRLLDEYPEALVAQVSWEVLASKFYITSSRYTEKIGQKIANIIFNLEMDHRVSSDRFVLIGHSLGAQISGWAGRLFFAKTGRKIQRIIALDPAQPLFKKAAHYERLNANDANVVFVVHTDRFLGFREPCGTIDFFVNGGCYQKLCVNEKTFKDRVFCDHTSAHKYLIEAITYPELYIGKECLTLENCKRGIVEKQKQTVSMGDLETNYTGLFHVATPDPIPNKIIFR